MPKAKLDHAFCLTADCAEGRRKTDYYDTITTGFVLEVRPAGKTYYLRYQDQHGRQKQLKIAAFGDISFDKARKEAQRLRSEVVLGGDPLTAKKAKRSVITYAELAAQHLEFSGSHLKCVSNLERILRIHLIPRWGRYRIDEITEAAIGKWLGELRTSLAPATVEKIRTVFGRGFALALRWDLPGVVKNPVQGIPRPKFENSRDRILSGEEAARLRKAVAASENPQLASIVALLILTGARKNELFKAKWADVDVDHRMWKIPETKNGSTRRVPLSQQAVDVINNLPRLPGYEYLIPNPKTGKPFNTIQHSWDTARRAANLPDLRLHDLRHVFCSSGVAAGVDLYTIGKIVGHKDYKSTQRYSHHSNQTLMKAVERSAANLNVDWT